MKTTAVLFADAASVRENLLNVLGAGITRLVRDPLPARLDAVLALMLQPDDVDDLMATHNLEVTITEITPESPVVVAKAVIEISGLPDSAPAVPLPAVPLVVPLQAAPIPRIGFYRITASLDGQDGIGYEFEVVKAPDRTSDTGEPPRIANMTLGAAE